jgi:hypothetical protein
MKELSTDSPKSGITRRLSCHLLRVYADSCHSHSSRDKEIETLESERLCESCTYCASTSIQHQPQEHADCNQVQTALRCFRPSERNAALLPEPAQTPATSSFRLESSRFNETATQQSIPPAHSVGCHYCLNRRLCRIRTMTVLQSCTVVKSLLTQRRTRYRVPSSAVVQRNDEPVAFADEHHADPRVEEQVVIPGTKAEEALLSPGSPIGPHTLANAVASLGQMFADINNLFPDQLSPLMSPPTYQTMNLEPAIGDNSPGEPKERKKPPMDLTTHRDKTPDDVAVRIQSDVTVGTQAAASGPAGDGDKSMLEVTAHSTDSPLLTASPTSMSPDSPHSDRPISTTETSPGELVLGQRMTLSMGRATYVPSQGQRDLSHFPPTPGPQRAETQFGTVSMGHAPVQSNVASFSAVVHGKITEPAPSSKSDMLDPPTVPKKRSSYAVKEGLVSPGQGELASLLHSAALLEETLEKGELPGEVSPHEQLARQEQEAQEKAEAEAKARAEEERTKQAMLKNRVKDQPKRRSKRSFGVLKVRNPAMPSSEGEVVSSKDTTTHLPFRPQPPTRRSTEGPSRPSEASSRRTLQAPSVEMHTDPLRRDPDAGSQTSPKSPLHYLANLRRFASASCTSGVSNAHPRDSGSTSSEMSSDDSVPLATPTDTGLDAGPISSAKSNHQGSSIQWPSLSPKKSGGSVGKAAAFAEKMWHRGRSKSNMSAKSAYDTIGEVYFLVNQLFFHTDQSN